MGITGWGGVGVWGLLYSGEEWIWEKHPYGVKDGMRVYVKTLP